MDGGSSGRRSDPVSELRDALVCGVYPHGAKLKADVLARDYGCSASALREALFRLSTEGLVAFRDQRGFRVPEASPALRHDITQTRIFIEEQGARLSIRRSNVAWEARLTAAHHKLSHLESRLERAEATDAVFQMWVAGEQEFHQTLMDNCGSPILLALHLGIYRRFRQQMIAHDRGFEHLVDNRGQHQEILQAALAGDEARICTAIRTHLGRHLTAPIPESREV
ncbi:GntR family transcriptional regulator [Pseudaestuariivita sp.]|uniref:GntR family transcriptional regulator n=1 Tax=Pseudaestuariivita sp. TaxID=2211669 RepID=UPI0040592377